MLREERVMTAEPEAFPLTPLQRFPNDPDLPVLLYRRACPADAVRIERRFAGNGWRGLWRDGIYDFDHYHSRGHEALGIARGSVRILLGGPGGREVDLAAGDAVVLPAGTGHRRLAASPDLLVVGAYPPGQSGDICRDAPDAEILARIAALPLPATDPVTGSDGALPRLWTRA
jgi:uncharacterized protein YjlB